MDLKIPLRYMNSDYLDWETGNNGLNPAPTAAPSEVGHLAIVVTVIVLFGLVSTFVGAYILIGR